MRTKAIKISRPKAYVMEGKHKQLLASAIQSKVQAVCAPYLTAIKNQYITA